MSDTLPHSSKGEVGEKMYFSFSLNPFAQGLLLSTLSNMKIKEQGEKKRGKFFFNDFKKEKQKVTAGDKQKKKSGGQVVEERQEG